MATKTKKCVIDTIGGTWNVPKSKKVNINPVEQAIWSLIASYKRYNGIRGVLDSDEVDTLCEYVKCVINENEGNS